MYPVDEVVQIRAMDVLTVYRAISLQKTTEDTKQERQISEGTEFDANEWPRSHVSFINKFQLFQEFLIFLW